MASCVQRCTAFILPPPQVYLVGDPVQLPATVISSRAQDHSYDCSLFKRLQVRRGTCRMFGRMCVGMRAASICMCRICVRLTRAGYRAVIVRL